MLTRTIACALVALTTALARPALAHEYKLGDLTIIHPWARASIGHAKTGAAYVVIANGGSEADRLIAARTDVAAKARLHTHTLENGVMKMRRVDWIEVAPGKPAVLEPGGFHIMLMGLKAPLVEGETFPLTLTFEKAGTIEVMVKIQKPADMKPHKHRHPGS